MKLLFVNACVCPQSRTLELCREYIALMKEKYENIEINELELGKMDLRCFDYDMLCRRDRDIVAEDFSSERYDMAKAFAGADIILIGAPYWDCSFPAVLKVFFEHISVNKLTFRYVGADCISMCHAEKLCYITTSGGYIGNRNSGERYISDMCSVFGIPQMQTVSAEGLDIYGNDVSAIMKEASKKMRQELIPHK